MAQDGVLPSALGRLHGDYPKIAVFTQTALSLFVVWAAGLRELLEFAGVTLSLSAGAVVVGWLYQHGRSAFSWRRLLPVVAAVFFLTATVGIVTATLVMRPASAIAATILVSFGLAAHAWGNRQVGTTVKRGELNCL